MQRRKYFKECAKDVIFSPSGSGMFENLFSVLILAAVSAGLLQTSLIFLMLFEPYVSDLTLAGLGALFAVLWFFAVCPVVYGFAKRMIYVSEGHNPPVSAMFFAFSSRKEAALSYRLFLAFALWGVCLKGLLALINGSPLFDRLAEINGVTKIIYALGFAEIVPDIIAISRAFTSVLAVIAAMLVLERLLCTLYLTARGFTHSVTEAYKTAGRVMKGKRFELLAIFISFIPWLILSFVTAGIAFAAFVLPYISITSAMFFRYAERRFTFESGGFSGGPHMYEADREYLSGSEAADESSASTLTHFPVRDDLNR